jgi:hypothetical protein
VTRRQAGVAVAAALLLAAPAPAEQGDAHDANHWMSRMGQAFRVDHTLSAHARVDVNNPGRESDFAFDMHLLRDRVGDEVRTLIEMRQVGDTRSVVNELVEKRGEPLTNWYWDLQKRRWIAIRGLLATDLFADTTFRYEDLWLTEPVARRAGKARWVDEGGRRWIQIDSDAYHYYLRVETRVDPETGLPSKVRFIDNTGAPIREQHYEQPTLVDGMPFPTIVRIHDLMAGGETTVTFGDVRFGRRIPPSFLDLSVIDDRIRRGVDPVPDPPDKPDLPDVPPVAPAGGAAPQ